MERCLCRPACLKWLSSQSCLRLLTAAAIPLLISLSACSESESPSAANDNGSFMRQMNRGKSHYQNDRYEKAVTAFRKAVELEPNNQTTHLNLANALLRAGEPDTAIKQARSALRLDRNSAAAYYIIGCAHLREQNHEEALKALQNSERIEADIPAVDFQIGRAHSGLGQWQQAIRRYQKVIKADPEHPSAYYNLARALQQVGDAKRAKKMMAQHQELQSGRSGGASDPAIYEACRHTKPKVGFSLAEPNLDGIDVTFTNATSKAFGDLATEYSGPFGILDVHQDGFNDVFLLGKGDAFQLLVSSNGTFHPKGPKYPAKNGGRYSEMLVGDLDNDRNEDMVALGLQGSHVFSGATNGLFRDVTRQTGMSKVKATDGALADLSFTGKLDLLTLGSQGKTVEVYRNLGDFFFENQTSTSGVPSEISGGTQLLMDHWNRDDMMDLVIARSNTPPIMQVNQRGGKLVTTNAPSDWPAGRVLTTGDLNNNMRIDTVITAGDHLECHFSGLDRVEKLPLDDFSINDLRVIDYDNDGWLDILAVGSGLKLWRNRGPEGFRNVTKTANLDNIPADPIQSLASADFDNDGDTDLLLSSPEDGIRFFRNDGGNQNRQLKLRLVGNRSNASGLGTRIEVTSGNWRTSRTVQQLPVEIGVGDRKVLDSVTVRWVDLSLNTVDVEVTPSKKLAMFEIELPEGSCPYLYAWDGQGYRFVTDILSAAPLGLPISQDRYIEADPKEYVRIGTDDNFKPKNGNYRLEVTEELREVLYLDEAKLVVVDHPKKAEVHSTSKLRPDRPFPPHAVRSYSDRIPLDRAVRNDGTDLTQALQEIDKRMASPTALRKPQLRGLAKPYHLTLDFGKLPTEKPLSLVLTGWLRFGGAMANIAAAQHPSLPFPFPQLKVETANGQWKPVDVVVGAPAGKTKTITVDLANKLPEGARRLRLSTAYEIHWDRIALFAQTGKTDIQVTKIKPTTTDLSFRGFSELLKPAWDQPLTPDYDDVHRLPNWRITPSGWCTRYGTVQPLIESTDNKLAILNGGDALSLSFDAGSLPPKPSGYQRAFFLYSVGWDKDADSHVVQGRSVKPLPWHGMDYQAYGSQARPESLPDDWIRRYNTRWVGQSTAGLNQWKRSELTRNTRSP